MVTPNASAQARHAAPRKSSAPVWTKQDCGQGVALRLSSPVTSQGNLLLAEVLGAKSLGEVKGEWNGIDISFWRDVAPAQKAADVRRALLGVDLELSVGRHDFTITARAADREPLKCSVAVSVKEGRFATEKLKVAPQFVEPDPEQLARAKEESKRLHEIFGTTTPEKLWNGRFRVPLAGVTTGGNFGKRRVLNGEPSSPHTGVDFPAPTGTPVHAAQSGRVVLAEPLYFSGNTVIIDHGLGIYTFYGHLSAFSVKAGDPVAPGALIGKVGATGRVTGPHLHWGLTVNRARVNSLQIVKLL